ncbi:MAG: biosynthetic arginine decarboxylase [Phycisphaeraceae bacterium]|nr:biosynthetic arginine decarboxylase [Phycisphaeraceae bacterium]
MTQTAESQDTLPTDQAESETSPSQDRWSAAQSAEMYGLEAWAGGYYAVSERGTIVAQPMRTEGQGVAGAIPQIDLHELIEGLSQREIYTPVLIRFTDMIHTRVREIFGAFADAIRDNEYKNTYCLVYPIKVNQQRQLCEEIRDEHQVCGGGLEAGSKPELLAVLGLTSTTPDIPIICNGFKDREYIEMVVLATKLGRKIIPVVERFHELNLIIEISKQYGVRQPIGLRIKPTASGTGRWQSSGGVRSKFGLAAPQALRALEYLKSLGMEDQLEMIHFHIGSQVCDIRRFKTAINELSRFYVELVRLGAGLNTIDIGGGLGLDYDGSQSTFDSSVNYTLQEYAADVVYRIKSSCDDAGIPHPRIISESGRAVSANSSVMVIDVLGRAEFPSVPDMHAMQAEIRKDPETPQPVLDLLDAYDRLSSGEYLEVYHDALQAKEEAATLFNLGYLSLTMRAHFERLFWTTCRGVLELAMNEDEPLHDDLRDLPVLLSEIYFCNFSLFQSLPDSWAIDQLFPICPIHRLNEEPTQRAVLCDITCDSDGQIAKFASPDSREYKETLELHTLLPSTKPNEEVQPYYLGLFLVGAYQEVLGDLHNLFGDTHVVYVSLTEDGGYIIDEIIEGDTVEEVLAYAQYDSKQLERMIRKETERAVKSGKFSVAESRALLKFYEIGMEGYTYLE